MMGMPVVAWVAIGFVVLLPLALWAVMQRGTQTIADLQAMVAKQSETYAARLAEQDKVIDVVLLRAQRAERRADEFFSIIEGVEKERDTWTKLYRQSSQHAGAAQAWLLRDLSQAVQRANNFARLLREKGEKVPDVRIDPALAEVVREFGIHAEGTIEVPHAPGMDAAKALNEATGVPAAGSPPLTVSGVPV
jgi:hypothetical protein